MIEYPEKDDKMMDQGFDSERPMKKRKK